MDAIEQVKELIKGYNYIYAEYTGFLRNLEQKTGLMKIRSVLF